MKIDRLMAILTILLRQEKITAPELADAFFKKTEEWLNQDSIQ